MHGPAKGGLRKGDGVVPNGDGDAAYPAPTYAKLGDLVATGEQVLARMGVE